MNHGEPATILLIEDEEDIQQMVSYNLVRKGYRVVCADSGEAGLADVERVTPDLVLLDIMLPGLDGMAVLARMRANPRTSAIPAIMLTAKGEERDIVAGLETGADDYIPKPFSPRVLLARVEAVLRRRRPAGGGQTAKVLEHHGLQLDAGRRLISFAGNPVAATATEFDILQILLRRPGWVYSRQQLIEQVRGVGHNVTERLVDVLVAGLRRKLGAAGDFIETVRGVGYRFRE
ncbi:MAG: response regulator transcription factor [Thermodesulfobacteriota bacterium]